MTIFYCDTETTGLLLDRHEIWEVAAIFPESDTPEHRWFLSVDLGIADPFALDIGRFHERHPDGHLYSRGAKPSQAFVDHGLTDHVQFARRFAKLTHGLHMVGAVPSFDDYRLAKLLRDHEEIPSWHYHTIDVEALAAAFVLGEFFVIQQVGKNPEADGPTVAEARACLPPWDSGALSQAVGVNPDDFDRHTALGDCQWAKAIYEAVMAT